MTTGDKKEKDKALTCRTLKAKILNVEFMLTLSGLVDIYDTFGALVQVTQMVHLLPHERFNTFCQTLKKVFD